jgi:lipid II:glycine glycyltransferase (peptidoglycan interpeptide bridge formation enzyme)
VIELNYKRGPLRVTELWFPNSDSIQVKRKKCDLILCRQAKEQFSMSSMTKFTTLVTELQLHEEQLLNKLSKNYRYEIRRSQKESLVCETFDSTFLKENRKIIDQFVLFFNKFASSRSLAPCNTRKLYKLLDGNHLTITACKNDISILAYHVYLHDNSRTRLWYSASNFRKFEDSLFKSLVGRANKLLHWNDILYFKSKDFNLYDWGGYDTSNLAHNLEGINKFKAEFGGRMEMDYSFSIPVTLAGKLFKVLYEKITNRTCY